MLKFSAANEKIKALSQIPELAEFLKDKRKVYSLDLLSGHSCPFAEKCLSKVVKVDGKSKIVDGKKTEFRCFSASQEALYPGLYNLREHNFNTLRRLSLKQMFDRISLDIPKNAGIIRIHVGGDFFNADYMNAWIAVAWSRPDILFYGYTKSLDYWARFIDDINPAPNLVLTASRGGRHDDLIAKHNFREAVVVYSEQQAADLGLEIDHDDSHAAVPSRRRQNFALLIHGTQPPKTEASKALSLLRKNKVKHSYGRKQKTENV